MLRTAFLGVTTLAALVIAAPAIAQWVKLSDVPVAHHRDRDATYSNFAGPVERLRFTARGSDIWCRSIAVQYRNGAGQQVFSGKLDRDRPVDADVHGGDRRIDRLAMNCTAADPRGGVVVVAADVGRFHQIWERSRDWASRMARKFEQNMGLHDENGWVSLGREFQARNDGEARLAGWRDRAIDRIALRPIDSDARCGRVSATFENGHTRDLDIDRREVMARGQMVEIDLPGGERNLSSIDLTCRAVGDRDVTIEILARH
jgi:hypothetical protein